MFNTTTYDSAFYNSPFSTRWFVITFGTDGPHHRAGLGQRDRPGRSGRSSVRQRDRAKQFFAEGIGWVPVDPADVRKVILEEPPGQLTLEDPKVEAARKRLFGSWEMNWLAYNTGHDIDLPNSKGPRLPFLMYPNGETGGERLDQLEPDRFRYTITAREV